MTPIDEPSAETHDRKIYYGWAVMPVAGLMLIGTLPGQTVVISQFNTALRESLGLTNESLSLCYLIGTLAAAFPLTLVGRLSDGIGPRRTAGLVVGAFCLGTLALTNAVSAATLTLGFFLVRFLGQGALGMLSSHVLALWFERRLATVESIKHAVFSLAGALAPAGIIALIGAVGWREAYAALGVCVAVVLLPLIAFVLRDHPEEVGQRLDNEPPESRPSVRRDRSDDPPDDAVFTLGEAMRTPAFWLLIIPGILSGLVGTSLLFHMQPLLVEAGVADPLKAGALAVSSWSVALFVGLTTGGPVADRLPPRAILPLSPLGIMASCVVMWAASEPWHAAAAMAIYGLGQGWGMAAAGPAIARFFGRPHHGAIRGFVTSAMVGGTAAGPYLLTLVGGWIGIWFGGTLIRGMLVFAIAAIPVAVGASLARRPAPPARPASTHNE
ncbi:MAG: MFS transporter [Planctomycetota bacterium]